VSHARACKTSSRAAVRERSMTWKELHKKESDTHTHTNNSWDLATHKQANFRDLATFVSNSPPDVSAGLTLLPTPKTPMQPAPLGAMYSNTKRTTNSPQLVHKHLPGRQGYLSAPRVAQAGAGMHAPSSVHRQAGAHPTECLRRHGMPGQVKSRVSRKVSATKRPRHKKMQTQTQGDATASCCFSAAGAQLSTGLGNGARRTRFATAWHAMLI
jgi:hypothetical protein